MLPPIRVLGVGSPFGLDQLAWQVIDLLACDPRLSCYRPGHLLLEKLDRPGAALLPYLEHAKYLFLLDVMLNEKVSAGEVIYYCKDEIRQAELHHSSHGFGLREALALAESLAQLPENMDVVAISLGAGDDQDELDWQGVITAAAEQLTLKIIKECEQVGVLSVTN